VDDIVFARNQPGKGNASKVTQQGAEPWAKCDVYDRRIPGWVSALSFLR